MTAPNVADTDLSAPIDDGDLASALNARYGGVDAPLGLLPDEEQSDTTNTITPDAETPAPDKTPETSDPDAGADPEGPPVEGEEDATASAPDPFAEMLAAGKPLTYTVDRQPKTFDGILEIEGKGALIPADKLADVRDRLAREESNAAYTKALHAETQRYEQAFGGFDGITQKLESSAQINAAALHIMDVLSKSRDERGNIALDAYSYNLLVKEAGLKAKEAQWDFRAERETQATQHAATAQDAQVRETAIPTAIASFKELHPTLTDADMAAATRHFSQFTDALMFKATPEQAAQWGVKPGTWMVDRNKMAGWFEDRVATQAQRTQTATAETARAKAAKENAARTPAKPAPKPKAPERPRNADGTFAEATERPSMTTIMNRALAGQRVKDGTSWRNNTDD